MTKRFALLTLCAFLSVVSCKSTHRGHSNLDHLQGDYGNVGPGFLWADFNSQDQIEAYIHKVAGETATLPSDLAMTQRIQWMVDRLDQIVRQINPDNVGRIPKPIAVIVADEETNAFVAHARLCIKQKVRAGASWKPMVMTGDYEGLEVEASEDSSIIYLGQRGMIYETGNVDYDGQDFCSLVMDADQIGWDLNWVVSQYNKLLNKWLLNSDLCEMFAKNGDLILPDAEGCVFLTKPTFDMVAIDVQAPVVFVNSGAVEKLSEAALAVALAHELSHFYNAHAAPIAGFSPFFYLQTPGNELRHPAPTVHHPALRHKLLESQEIMESSIPGYILEPALFDYSIEIVSNVLGQSCFTEGESPCPRDFLKLKEFMETEEFSNFAMEYGISKLTEQDKKLYLEYQELLFKGLDKFKTSLLDYNQVDLLIWYASSTVQKYLAPIDEFKTIGAWLKVANKNIHNNLPLIKQAFADAAELGLGYYSYEEQADELGTELSARAGFTKEQAAGAYRELAENGAADPDRAAYPYGVEWKECLKLWQNGWKDTGSILLGTLLDTHHSSCYRIYNIEREWDAHQLDNIRDPNGFPLLGKEWNSLVEEMKKSPSIPALSMAKGKKKKAPPIETLQCMGEPRRGFR